MKMRYKVVPRLWNLVKDSRPCYVHNVQPCQGTEALGTEETASEAMLCGYGNADDAEDLLDTGRSTVGRHRFGISILCWLARPIKFNRTPRLSQVSQQGI